jgi:transposase-like protein
MAMPAARNGMSSDEWREQLVELHRRNRVLEMEIEILKPANAYFARENVFPNWFRLVKELAAG